MPPDVHTQAFSSAEKIYARKLMMYYAPLLGSLSEKAVTDLTAFNTFFDEKQLNVYLSEGISRILHPEDKIKQTPGKLRRVVDCMALGIQQEILSHEDFCPRVEAGGKNLYTSQDLLQAETDIIETAKRMSERRNPYFPGRQVLDIAEDFGVYWSAAQGRSPSPELNAALAAVLEPGELRLINGPPGAGKSALCAGVAYCMRAYMDTPPYFITTSPSDKAAAALHADVQFAASALDDKQPEKSRVEGYSLYDLIDKMNDGFIAPGSVIIVDEAGLMGTRDMASFMKAADKVRAKLFLLGDNRQIPPLPAGNGFDLMISHVPEVSRCNVTRILRQTTPGEAKASAMIRNGQAGKALDFYASQKYQDGTPALDFYKDADEVFDSLAKDYVSFMTSEDNSGRSSVVLATDDAAAEVLNRKLRSELKKNGIIKKSRDIVRPDGSSIELGLGDAVMFTGKMETKNGKETENVNPGTTARVVDMRGGNVGLMLDNQKKRVYISEAETEALRPSWALPLYVAQGVSRSKAFLAIDRAGSLDLANGLVAFTRHEDQISAYISKKAYPDCKALAAEMEVFSSRKPVIRDYVVLEVPAKKPLLSLAQMVTRALTQERTM